MEFKVRLPSLRPLVLPLALLVAVIGFMALDRTILHWYVPEDTQEVEEDVQLLDTELGRLASRVGTVETEVTQLPAPGIDEGEFARTLQIRRLTNAVAIVSLVQNNGGFQSTTSPAGRACIQFLLSGTGSVTDCGFEHVD